MKRSGKKGAGDDLYELIARMTPSERRYITLYGSVQKRDPGYLQLFRFLATEPRYDEQRIRERFSGAPFLRNLNVARAYLRSAILRGLRAYHDNGDVDARLRRFMSDAAILASKGLVDQALDVLDDAEEIAVRHERDLTCLEIHEKRSRWVTDIEGQPGRSRAVLNMQVELIDRCRNAYQLEHLRRKLDALYFVHGKARTDEEQREYREILEHPLLNGTEGLTRDSLLQQHAILATAAYADRDYEGAERHIRARQAIFDQHSRLVEERPAGYVAILTNLIVLNLRLERFDEVERLFTELESFPARVGGNPGDIESIKLQIFRFGAGMRLATYFLRGESSEGSRLVPSILTEIDRWGAKLSDYDRVRLFFQICCIRYGTGDFEGSLHALRTSIAHTNWRVRTNVTRTARFVELVLLFELGDISTLEYRVEALRRLLQRRGMYHRTEATLLRAFGTLPNLFDGAKLKRWFASLHEELLAVQEDPNEQDAFADFPFLEWLRKKVCPELVDCDGSGNPDSAVALKRPRG